MMVVFGAGAAKVVVGDANGVLYACKLDKMLYIRDKASYSRSRESGSAIISAVISDRYNNATI